MYQMFGFLVWNETAGIAGGEEEERSWEGELSRLQNIYNVVFCRKKLEVNMSEC